MSTKWLVVLLISIFMLTGIVGYLFLRINSEKQNAEVLRVAPLDIETLKDQIALQEFDYTKNRVTGTVLEKTNDDDGNPAFRLYVSWPPNAPIYDKNVVVSLSCLPALSNLILVGAGIQNPQSEKAIVREIDVYSEASENDVVRFSCVDPYCSEMGGVCELLKFTN